MVQCPAALPDRSFSAAARERKTAGGSCKAPPSSAADSLASCTYLRACLSRRSTSSIEQRWRYVDIKNIYNVLFSHERGACFGPSKATNSTSPYRAVEARDGRQKLAPCTVRYLGNIKGIYQVLLAAAVVLRTATVVQCSMRAPLCPLTWTRTNPRPSPARPRSPRTSRSGPPPWRCGSPRRNAEASRPSPSPLPLLLRRGFRR